MRGFVASVMALSALVCSPAVARDAYITTGFVAQGEVTAQEVAVASAGPLRGGQGKDQPDAVAGSQTHAIYFVPADRRDERLDGAGGLISRSLSGMQSWFRASMGRAPRIDRTRSGRYDITFVRGRGQAKGYGFDSIVAEVRARGFDVASKRYVIFAAVSRGAVCGESQYPLGAAPSVGRFVAVWLDSAVQCRSRDHGKGTASTSGYTETILTHEWLHAEGVVPTLAPRHCSGAAYHTCTGGLWLFPAMDPEANDVMFPFAGAPLREKILDRGRDDYLDHGWQHVRDLRDSRFIG